MKKLFQIVAVGGLVILIVNRAQIRAFFNAGEDENHPPLIAVEDVPSTEETPHQTSDYLVNDSLYRWDDVNFAWETVKPSLEKMEQVPKPTFASLKAGIEGKPTKIDWALLLAIEYNLKYYQAFEMKIYAPVFTEQLIALDGKEVIIEGFVIPLDEEGDLVALSANPFAACFFCGKASPASVMSLYLKKKKLYKMDDFRKFRGTLRLNYNNPEEYYYILEDAVPK